MYLEEYLIQQLIIFILCSYVRTGRGFVPSVSEANNRLRAGCIVESLGDGGRGHQGLHNGKYK